MHGYFIHCSRVFICTPLKICLTMGEEGKKSDLHELKSSEHLTSDERVENERHPERPECSRTRAAKNESSPSQVGFQSTTPHSTELRPAKEESECTPVSSNSKQSFPKGCDDFSKRSHPETKGCATGYGKFPTQCSSSDKKEESTSMGKFYLLILRKLLDNTWKKLFSDICNRLDKDREIPLALKGSCALWDELTLPKTIFSGGPLILSVNKLEDLLVSIVKTFCSRIRRIFETDMGHLVPQNVTSTEYGKGSSITSTAESKMCVIDIEKIKPILEKLEGQISTDIKTFLEDCQACLRPHNANSPSLPRVAELDKMFTIDETKLILEKIWKKFSSEFEKMIEPILFGSS